MKYKSLKKERSATIDTKNKPYHFDVQQIRKRTLESTTETSSKKAKIDSPIERKNPEYSSISSGESDDEQGTESFNQYASQSEGYDSQFEENKKSNRKEGFDNDLDAIVDNLSKIDGSSGTAPPPISEKWANLLENNWKNDFSKEQFNELYKKYTLPKIVILMYLLLTLKYGIYFQSIKKEKI